MFVQHNEKRRTGVSGRISKIGPVLLLMLCSACVAAAEVEQVYDQHAVHLRRGTVQMQSRLPPIIISEQQHQRRLHDAVYVAQSTLAQGASVSLQQSSSSRSSVTLTSPFWGPLPGSALWLLSLGRHARDAEQQSRLLRDLLAQGGESVSFLPPSAWLILLPLETDMGRLLLDFDDVRLEPYHPAYRQAPEWDEVLPLAGHQHASQRVAQGEGLTNLAHELLGRSTATLMGGLQSHRLRSARAIRPGSMSHTSASNSSSSSSSLGALAVLVEVQFPELESGSILRHCRRSLIGKPICCARHEAGTNKDQATSDAVDAGCDAATCGCVYNPAAAAMQDWRAALQKLGTSLPSAAAGCGMELVLEHGSLMVAACPQDLPVLLAWLAEQPSVYWVAPRMARHYHNLVASAISQTGGVSSRDSARQISAHPLWQVGLDGSGQIIGCGDSGLDMYSCYFSDPKVDFLSNIQTDPASGSSMFLSDTHRKVRMYLALQDLQDGYGHGTHVSGTLVGASINGLSSSPDPSTAWLADVATGMAPAARIAFMDLSRGDSDSVWTPNDLGNSYFARTYNVGARVHSDSWGSGSTGYDSMASALDRFTYNRQDFVSVVAAGNSGGQSGYFSTITSPAVAKNCITVGATYSALDGFRGGTSVTVVSISIRVQLAGSQSFSRTFRVVQAPGPGLLSFGTQALTVSVATPSDLCSSMANSGGTQGTLVVARRSLQCNFMTKIANAQAGGVAALLITNNADDGYFPIGVSGSSLPTGGVPRSAGDFLYSVLQPGNIVTATFLPATSSTQQYDDIAPFSSFGPTTDGRIKPDIVAPGFQLSSYPDARSPTAQTCNKTLDQGTSMATPVIAGSAALVRQYFMRGFYPSGAPVVSDVYTPSGVLIKAVLMAGAINMKGNVEVTYATGQGLPLEDAPSMRQGFGRVDLLRSLPLANIAPNWAMQVVDGAALATGESDRYCIRATGTGPLRIILAWYDYPASAAAQTALVNDLDLEVRSAGLAGLVLLGNGRNDSINNVEIVALDSIPAGNVAITVSARSIYASGGPQAYALVALGAFSGALYSDHNPMAGANISTGQCVITLAVIDDTLSTPLLTRNRNVQFVFTTQSGVSPAGGFECRLTYVNGSMITANWTSCSSPQSYTDLTEGVRVFQVRSRGEDVYDSRTFTIAYRPPITQLTNNLPSPTGGGGRIVTDARDVTFNFTAASSVPVTFDCYITFSALGTTIPPYLSSPSGPVSANTWIYNCTSPFTLLGLSFGSWAVSVRASDIVGNVEVNPMSVAWQEQYTSGVVYTRTVASTTGLTNAGLLQSNITAFTGGGSAPPTMASPSSYLFSVLRDSASPPTSWNMTTSTTIMIYPSTDGRYTLVARAVDGSSRPPATPLSTDAVSTFIVDRTPPRLNISSSPVANQTSPVVTIKFASDPPDDAVSYVCRLVGPATSPPSATATPDSGTTVFGPCIGPATGTVTANVSEGYYLFQVKGTDAAGNESPAVSASFRTHLNAPVITADSIPSFTQQHRVSLVFSVNNGVVVPGDDLDVQCKMAPNVTTRGVTPVSATPQFPSPPVSWVENCTSPLNYTLQEGQYTFSVQATDFAGLKTQEDYTIYVDNQAPLASVTSPRLGAGVAVPSKVTITYGTRDLPDGSPSGTASTECLLNTVTAPPPPVDGPPPRAPSSSTRPPSIASPPFPAPRPPPMPLPAAAGGPVTTSGTANFSSGDSNEASGSSNNPAAGDEGTGRRRLAGTAQAVSQDMDASNTSKETTHRRLTATGPMLGNSTPVVFGQWLLSPSIVSATYSGLPSGFYTFQVRATDRAGNVGNASALYFLQVDDTLPIDGASSVDTGDSGSKTTRRILMAVFIAVGVVALLLVICCVVFCRKRILRHRALQRYNVGPHGSPPLATPPIAAHANGRSNGGGAVNGHIPYSNGVPSYTNGSINGAYVNGIGSVPYASGHSGGGRAYHAQNGNGQMDAAMLAALQASEAEQQQRQWAEEARVRAALDASLEEENVRKAVAASLALQGDTSDVAAGGQQAPHSHQPPPENRPPRQPPLQLSAAAEEEDRRLAAAIALSLQSALPATPPAGGAGRGGQMLSGAPPYQKAPTAPPQPQAQPLMHGFDGGGPSATLAAGLPWRPQSPHDSLI